MIEPIKLERKRHVTWPQVQQTVSSGESVPASCEGLYFNAPVPYVPGENLTCRLEAPVDDEPGLTICIEYKVKVLRIDASGDTAGFGIACLIYDLISCTLQRSVAT
jgi:hypothetical protein